MKLVIVIVCLLSAFCRAGQFVVVDGREPVLTFSVIGSDVVNDDGDIIGGWGPSGWWAGDYGGLGLIASGVHADGPSGSVLVLSASDFIAVQDRCAAANLLGVFFGVACVGLVWFMFVRKGLAL